MEGIVNGAGVQDVVSSNFHKAATDAMTLPYDVLFELFPLLQFSADISSLMRTCKALYKHGVRFLLQDHIYIDERMIKSFCLFMKADITRCQHLHALRFPYPTEVLDPHTQGLAQILIMAPNLRKVHIQATEALDYYPELLDAITNMTSLNDLVIEDWSKSVELLLANTRSPVRNLEVSLARVPDDYGTYTEIFYDMINLQGSLEKLNVDWATWDEAPADLCFAKVYSLRVYGCDAANIMTLITIFPALKELTVRTNEHSYPYSDNHQDFARAENISRQHVHGSWPSLDYADLTPKLLYTLAPICKVTTLHTSCSYMDVTMSRDRWEAALASTHPENLYLEISREEDLADLVDILGRIPTSVVRLSLSIDLHKWTSPVEDAFDALRTALASRTSLVHINLTFRWTFPSAYVIREGRIPEPDPPSSRREFLQQLDRFAMAQELANKIASLKYLCLNIVSENRDYSTLGPFWTVETADGERCLTELSNEEGLRALTIWDRPYGAMDAL